MDANADLRDEDLLRRAHDGDEGALDRLLSRYAGTMRHRVGQRLPPHLSRKVSVADVLQEARLAVHRHGGEFEDRGDGSFRNWLLTIVDRKVGEMVRRHARTAKRAIDREITRGRRAETGQFVAPSPSPSEVAIASELQELAQQALASLPADYREVLRLAREDNFTLREVAARMGRSREAVKKLYGRALLRFKEAFDRLGGSGDDPR